MDACIYAVVLDYRLPCICGFLTFTFFIVWLLHRQTFLPGTFKVNSRADNIVFGVYLSLRHAAIW